MNNWDLIEKANQKLTENNNSEAFKLYASFLDEQNEGWKKVFLGEIHDQLSTLDLNIVFTGFNADLLLLTETKDKDDADRGYIIYLVNFLVVTEEGEAESERFEKILQNKAEVELILEEVLPNDRDIEVKNMIIAGDGENPFVEHNKQCIMNDHIRFAMLEDFQLIDLLPADELDMVSSDFFDFAHSLTVYLQPDDFRKKLEKENSNDAQIEDISPTDFLKFIDHLKPIFSTEPKLSNIFGLSLNMVYINQNNVAPFDIASYFLKSVYEDVLNDKRVEVIRYRFNEIESASDFSSFLEEQRWKIVVIENLEYQLNAERLMQLDVSKTDLVQILCDFLERNTKNIFILSLNKTEWEKQETLNPLLRVCFQHIFHFKQYNENHLLNYFKNNLKKKHYSISQDAKDLAKDYFHFLNRQLAPRQFQPILSTMLSREVRYYNAVSANEQQFLDEKWITKIDVMDAIKDEYSLEKGRPLNEIMLNLDQLVGLESVKQSIKEYAAFVKMTKLRKSDDEVSLNAIFSGNPGTGKTTVASILGEIYKSIGVLSKGHVVTVKRHDIVDQFIGYTARNMKNFIDQARGGILFIDEAYALYKKDNERDFGQEAIDTLVAEMENIKDSTCVILAGYPDLMANFLNSNPGLSSRFPHYLRFTDYDDTALSQIFYKMVESADYQLDNSAITILNTFFARITKEKTKHFGNARECRNLFEKLKLIHASRIIYSEEISTQNLQLIRKEDVEKLIRSYFKSTNNYEKPRRVGFM
ncbi:AAA family ATPase [Labilibacter marinus]|uniref:AAA family ATPase n=1 Tax=Labilibacter marinus TaxID=1477105 RepID=UPI0008309CF2|nr:AAA family ATPase [Labilibacter marinus]